MFRELDGSLLVEQALFESRQRELMRQRNYYQENKQEARARCRAYYQRNRTKRLEDGARWRALHERPIGARPARKPEPLDPASQKLRDKANARRRAARADPARGARLREKHTAYIRAWRARLRVQS